MAGLSLSLWVLQPLVAGRFLGLGGMRVAYTICICLNVGQIDVIDAISNVGSFEAMCEGSLWQLELES